MRHILGCILILHNTTSEELKCEDYVTTLSGWWDCYPTALCAKLLKLPALLVALVTPPFPIGLGSGERGLGKLLVLAGGSIEGEYNRNLVDRVP